MTSIAVANKNSNICNTCGNRVDFGDEGLYWHRKIHIINLEEAILNKQFEYTTKVLSKFESEQGAKRA